MPSNVRLELEQLVRAPRDRVYAVWNDCEAWPTWDPVIFKRVTVAERKGNTRRLEASVKFMGRAMTRTEDHVLTPPDKVEVRGGVPGIANTTEWRFEPAPEGTRLTAVLEVQLAGFLKVLGPVVGWQARSVTRRWMEALASHVESTEPEL